MLQVSVSKCSKVESFKSVKKKKYRVQPNNEKRILFRQNFVKLCFLNEFFTWGRFLVSFFNATAEVSPEISPRFGPELFSISFFLGTPFSFFSFVILSFCSFVIPSFVLSLRSFVLQPMSIIFNFLVLFRKLFFLGEKKSTKI